VSPRPAVFSGLEQARLPGGRVHLALGMFDGVHRGHQAVVESAVQAARAGEGLAGVFTFWPHPTRLLRPDQPTPMIFGRETRAAMLGRLGVDFVVEQTFDPAFAAMEAGAFPAWLRRGLPGLETLYVGDNWRFGHGRRGDAAMLVALARAEGIGVVGVAGLSYNGRPISSSRIRELLAAGDVEAAGAMLGQRYFAEGVVVPGRRLGRTLGFPTLNLEWRPELRPAFGVYAVRIRSAGGGGGLPGVANYGVRPTVGGAGGPLLEVHVLEACPFGEGDAVRVEWLAFLRGERRFGSVGELRGQIARDVATARAAAVRPGGETGP
jgi:riboflavin kinase/FMN adenylyltransferase